MKRVKKASEIVKWLEDNDYEFVKYQDDYVWMPSVINAYEGGVVFYVEMFEDCGSIPSKKYKWLPEWLEEVPELLTHEQIMNGWFWYFGMWRRIVAYRDAKPGEYYLAKHAEYWTTVELETLPYEGLPKEE